MEWQGTVNVCFAGTKQIQLAIQFPSPSFAFSTLLEICSEMKTAIAMNAFVYRASRAPGCAQPGGGALCSCPWEHALSDLGGEMG